MPEPLEVVQDGLVLVLRQEDRSCIIMHERSRHFTHWLGPLKFFSLHV